MSPFRNRDYLIVYSGQAISSVGTGISNLAFPLLILSLTHSPALAGFGVALRTLPYFFVVLPAGVLIDRWNRKRMMIICDTGRALCFGSIPLALLLGHLTLIQLYIVAFLEGALFVTFDLATTASLPTIVTEEQLPAVTGQFYVLDSVSSLLGSPLGGMLYNIGQSIPFIADTTSYLVSIASLFFTKRPFQKECTSEKEHALLGEAFEGLKWLWRFPAVRLLAILTAGLNLAFYPNTLIIIVLSQQQHLSSLFVGVIFSIGSIGFLLGALFGPSLQRQFRLATLVRNVCWLFVVGWPLFALAPNGIVVIFILALLSCARSIYGVTLVSFLLTVIPDVFQGRVNAVFRLIATATVPLGQAFAGILLQLLGVRITILVLWVFFVIIAIVANFNSALQKSQQRELPTRQLVERDS